MSSTIVLALSGGMDSVTLLCDALEQGHVVWPVSFEYGSKHNKYENLACKNVLRSLGMDSRLRHIDLTALMAGFKSNLLHSGGEVPEGHYEASTMSQTVVPCRNMIFASILAGLAESMEANQVWLGIHSGDHLIYPDCRPDFYYAMREAMRYGTDGKVDLCAPFLTLDKTSIIAKGTKLNVPYYLTRTCYKDQPIACGKCGSCQERLEAFANNKLTDPIMYQSRELLPKT